MTLTQLKYILAVAEARHFAKASRKCFVSQPTLSTQIQKLEEQLGVLIFDRSRHPITPTLAGEKIIAQARKVIIELEMIREIASDSKGIVEGSFRLGVIPTVAANLIPLFHYAFQRSYPLVALTLEELTTEGILSSLASDELDGGIAATPLDQDGLDEAPLYYEDFYLYAGRNFGKKPGEKISQTDIDRRHLLLMQDGHCFRNQALKLCRVGQKQTQGVKYEGGSFQTLMKLVDAGSGMTLIPQLTALSLEKEKFRSRVFAFIDPVPRREISMITRRRYAKASIVRAIIDTIQQVLPQEIETENRKKGKIINPLAE